MSMPSTPSSSSLQQLRSGAKQGELPFALVMGEAVTQLPEDLYIPPDALEVFLRAFEGPLDLLLYLIKKQNLDILDVNVAEITHQYMAYVELMQEVVLDVAGDYLVMAAMLAEIKSRMLLPKPTQDEHEEEDPRAELIRRLQEYEQFKEAAAGLDQIPRRGRDFLTPPGVALSNLPVSLPEVDLTELLLAMRQLLLRESMYGEHQVVREPLSTRARIQSLLALLEQRPQLRWQDLIEPEAGRAGVVVSFLALMELMREHIVEVVQNDVFGELHLRLRPDADVSQFSAQLWQEEAPQNVE